ncbi:MAG: helix-turn-helix transcriptional regulator [Ruminococcus sp.]|nr:helix-turn-helix transcriptional regulator [Candidatus Apopatosoma intestinale]
MEFGNKLKDARIKKGLSQQELAEKLFVTRQTVSRWESGNRYPDYDVLNRISAELDVSASELLGQNEINNMTISAVNDRKSRKIMIIALVSFAMSAAILVVSIFSFINVKRIGKEKNGFGVSYFSYDEYARQVYGIPYYCGFFVYEDNADVEKGYPNGFTICLLADGRFSYYETMLSSYLGFGHYKCFEDGRMILETDDGKFRNTFIYSAVDDTLTFVADGSTNFLYKKLADKTVFRRSEDRSEGIFIRVD